MRVEIYGLYDPETDELRYIGKANDHKKRLKTHIFDSKYNNRPVCRWVAKLVKDGKAPVSKVLSVVNKEDWEAEEKRLIAEYRKTHNLLNLADGGAMPSQTKEQRKNASRAAYKASRSDPIIARYRDASKNLARLRTQFERQGAFFHAYVVRFMMKCYAAHRPEMHKTWLTL